MLLREEEELCNALGYNYKTGFKSSSGMMNIEEELLLLFGSGAPTTTTKESSSSSMNSSSSSSAPPLLSSDKKRGSYADLMYVIANGKQEDILRSEDDRFGRYMTTWRKSQTENDTQPFLTVEKKANEIARGSRSNFSA
jgi:hypothetical protein